MRISRHVVARKNQWLVALPAEVRRHLALVPGATVWWHVGAKGRATLTVTGRSAGGRPTRSEDCPSCAKYREELDRLRRELRDGETATAAAWWRQGASSVARELFWDLDDLVKAVRALLLAIQLQGPRAKPAATAQRRAVGACRVCGEAWAAHPKPDHAWDTPPSGAAATPEAKPPALPVEK